MAAVNVSKLHHDSGGHSLFFTVVPRISIQFEFMGICILLLTFYVTWPTNFNGLSDDIDYHRWEANKSKAITTVKRDTSMLVCFIG